MSTQLTTALFAALMIFTTGCAGYDSNGPQFEETLSEEDAVLSEGTGDQNEAELSLPSVQPELPKSEAEALLTKYEHLDPNREIRTDLLKKAVLYFDANQSKFANKKYLSVIDFSKSSKYKRFFIVDLNTGKVWAIRTSHGKGSDANHDGIAEKFSNVSGSNASSLGMYKTAETYNGKYGRSLRLDGLSSTNSNARARAVVIHGANYVSESSVIQGRSWGCPAIAMAHKDKLIDMIKGGSLIYAGI